MSLEEKIKIEELWQECIENDKYKQSAVVYIRDKMHELGYKSITRRSIVEYLTEIEEIFNDNNLVEITINNNNYE
nr:MAG TPA: Post-transcriptional regulator [Caudoviricetes sp.]